jgi:hypothetical protein
VLKDFVMGEHDPCAADAVRVVASQPRILKLADGAQERVWWESDRRAGSSWWFRAGRTPPCRG